MCPNKDFRKLPPFFVSSVKPKGDIIIAFPVSTVTVELFVEFLHVGHFLKNY